MTPVGPSVPDQKDPPMLKNLNPVISGDLLRVLDSIRPGQSLAIVSEDNPYGGLSVPPVQIPSVSVEEAVEAIFSVLQLASDAPLLSWVADTNDEHAEDIAYAVRGLATDAERRRIDMTAIVDSRDFAAEMGEAVATISFPETSSPWAFLIRAGGAESGVAVLAA